MLSVFLSWLLIILIFYSFGDAFVCLYNKVTKQEELYTFIEIFFIGLISSSTVISILSLLYPINIRVTIALASFSILYIIAVKYKTMKNNLRIFIHGLSSFDYILIFSSVMVLLLFVLMPPQFSDVYIYHIQNMMWNEEYAVVPGLANIDEHFGFNSNVFLLYPLFGIRPLVGGYVYGVNAICLLFVLLFIISQFRNNKIYTSLFFLVLFVLFLLLYRTHVGSSTDLLPNLLILFLLFLVLADSENFIKKSLLFWALPLLCVTFKLSTIFICLLSLCVFIYFCKNRAYKTNVFIVISSMSIIIPWIVRNVVVSGYLIYPYPAIDIFNFDWKLPLQYVIESKEYITAFAITMDVWGSSSEDILSLPIHDKIYRWIVEEDLMDIGLVTLGLFSIIFMFALILKNKIKKNINSTILVLVWGIGVLGFVFMLVMAPAVRFSLSFIIITIVIPPYLFLLNNKTSVVGVLSNISRYSIVLFLLLFACLGLLSVRIFKSVKSEDVSYVDLLFRPQGVESRANIFPIEKEPRVINDILFWVIRRESCCDLPLPCINNQDVADRIEMRGEKLQEGFRTSK